MSLKWKDTPGDTSCRCLGLNFSISWAGMEVPSVLWAPDMGLLCEEVKSKYIVLCCTPSELELMNGLPRFFADCSFFINGQHVSVKLGNTIA